MTGRKFYEAFAGFGGFTGVLLGAVAAHKTMDPYLQSLLQEASLYCLLHSIVILFISGRTEKPIRFCCLLFTTGIILFCGGLSAKALTGPVFLTKLVPGGGTCLMLGWLSLFIGALNSDNDQAA